MQRIVTNLWFDTQAEEAANFYVSLFPNSQIVDVMRYTDAGPGIPDTVVTVTFRLDGQTYTGINGGPQFKFTEAISLLVNCADQAEVDRLWYALTADGGEESMCGWLKDKYGLSWQIVPTALEAMLKDPNPAKAKAATEAMLKMQKLDLAVLQAAYDAG
jgi:predicted 3-demethylubiquinone-9 3-methyltransferase (glyoxalase superfamily)